MSYPERLSDKGKIILATGVEPQGNAVFFVCGFLLFFFF